MLEGVLSTVQHNECSYGFSVVCDRIENSDRTGSDWDHFGRNRTGTGPDYEPEKVNRIQPDFLNFNI